MRLNFKGMDKVLDLILVNILFVLCALPVFTIGAAAAAMFDTLRRLKKGEGGPVKLYVTRFFRNFRQATCLWLIQLALLAAVLGNLWLVSQWAGPLYYAVSALLVIALVFVLAWGAVVYPMAAVFENSTAAYAKNAFFLVLAFPVKSLMFAGICLLPAANVIFLPGVALALLPLWSGVFFSLLSMLIQKLLDPMFMRISREYTP